MSDLTKLQADFQAYLLGDGQLGPFHAHIVDDPKVGAVRRLGIYHDAYRLRLIEVLASGYPKLHMLLGDERFDQEARAYIDAHPSSFRNVRWYGDAMRAHLAKTLPQHPIAAELAGFEWALSLAFDAPDTPVLQVQDLAAIAPEDWGGLCFKLQPALQMLRLDWNTVAVWKALDAEQAPPAPERNPASEAWLIWRRDLNAHFRSLDTMEEAALRQALDGMCFADICAGLSDELPQQESAMQAANYLAAWLQEGMLSHARPA